MLRSVCVSPALRSQLRLRQAPIHRNAPHRAASDGEGAVGRRSQAAEGVVTHEDLFRRASGDSKSKAAFSRVVEVFSRGDVRRRGHVEFIYAALRKMPEYGVERDLAVYNRILDVFPKEVFLPRNFIQRMFNHFPRQQECGVQLLEQMESYGVTPNVETKVLLARIFGEKSHPMRKYERLMYWFPRFKHINPFPVPHTLTSDPVDLARISLARIANDLDAEITVYQYPPTDASETHDDATQTHIVGVQSPEQRALLARHDPRRPVFVEGPFPLWLRKTCVHYYLLRADPLPPEQKQEDEELLGAEQSIFYPQRLELDLERDPSEDYTFDVDHVEEGRVYAMVMTGRGDQATLARWISALQESNSILGHVTTLFRLEPGARHLQSPGAEAEPLTEEEEEEPRQARGAEQ